LAARGGLRNALRLRRREEPREGHVRGSARAIDEHLRGRDGRARLEVASLLVPCRDQRGRGRQVIGEESMPMIDVYATGGTFSNPRALARDLASTLMKIDKVPDIPMFRKNTAAFIHDLPDGALSNVEGDGNYVRVQVLTNAGALNRDKQLAVVRQFTDLVASAAGDPSLTARTWVLLTEAVEGGWGLAGHANTNAELVAAARAQIAELPRANTSGA